MDNPVVLAILGTAVGLTLGYIIARVIERSSVESLRHKTVRESEELIRDAKSRAAEIEQSVEQKSREEIKWRTKQAERELSRRRHELDRRDRKLNQRESANDRCQEDLNQLEKETRQVVIENNRVGQDLEERQKALEPIRVETIRRCEEVSGLTSEQARKMILEMLESDVRQDAAAMVRRIETETRELANKKARQIITLAVQRCATDQVSEITVSVLNLPNDDMKGRIIGKEGRNIRALEAATGCNIIVDETPEAVVLSCFDPLRREIARLSLERLLSDGRIHPTRIEEVVSKVEKEMADHIWEVGGEAVHELGISDMHPELVKTLGRLKYRTSYGQNMLMHSIEVSRLCSFLASELGADVESAKRGGLLHDIGKALSYEMEGTHALIGADLAKRCNEAPSVVHAISAHHNEEEPRTIVAVLVQTADMLSSARPGSRREAQESYVKRMEGLEAIADSFNGVNKAYAIQAGRELRIMVEPTEVNDNEAALLAREITKKIEGELDYPGQIQVTVCRETRAIEYAK
jgi:ribonuclease Y